MTDPRTVDLLLRLDLHDEVVSGSVEDEHGRRWPFYGWLELGSILDTVRSRTEPDVRPDAKHQLEPG
jgi:hypothetical protein